MNCKAVKPRFTAPESHGNFLPQIRNEDINVTNQNPALPFPQTPR